MHPRTIRDRGLVTATCTMLVVLHLAHTWQGRSLQRPECCVHGMQPHLASQCPRPRAQAAYQALSILPGMGSQAVVEPSPHACLCSVATAVSAVVTHEPIQPPSCVPRPRARLPKVEHQATQNPDVEATGHLDCALHLEQVKKVCKEQR